jgi:hypothetical protein
MVVRVLAKELLERLGKLWILKSRAKAAMGDGRWRLGKVVAILFFLELKSDAAATSAILPCKPRSALCSTVAPLLLLRQYLRIDLAQGFGAMQAAAQSCSWRRSLEFRLGDEAEVLAKFWWRRANWRRNVQRHFSAIEARQLQSISSPRLERKKKDLSRNNNSKDLLLSIL